MAEQQDGSNGKSEQFTDHEYDGIREYDNPMPGWWKILFWLTFVFSLGYLFHYWIGNGVGDVASYEDEMADVRAASAKQAMAQAVSEQSLELVLADASSVAKGSEVFATRCAPCHSARGEGLIGPNLTDDSWVHGRGKLLDIYDTVAHGVLDKGMPAWDRQLTPGELRQVVAFVGTLRGTKVPGKPPEGTPVQ